ncbi:HEAT repeat domain-containing protein [Paractinoplanes hotanensis]|uniref:HEAT repeat domain-containing protein n=1 Tax=Paractinoplanes hotanensis TaxID=2906497 RepID=A0ABT0Y2K7_9ACTN|nr:HEAT repeat domain-containing protein [Actinoplanes hotanensis]MCM4080260.1 HEAT repeat domain-containing protein [Actinoplanes hotanensis]
MLEKLDDVPWSDLHHAYGPADDVPAQLRALRSDDADVRKKSLWSLFGTIFHQGTRYEASSHAVPFLLELAAAPATPSRESVIELLVALAIGSDESYLPGGFPLAELQSAATGGAALLRDGGPLASLPEADQDRLQARIELNAYEAVAAGVPLFVPLLKDPDPAVRRMAAYALGWFPAPSPHFSSSGPDVPIAPPLPLNPAAPLPANPDTAAPLSPSPETSTDALPSASPAAHTAAPPPPSPAAHAPASPSPNPEVHAAPPSDRPDVHAAPPSLSPEVPIAGAASPSSVALAEALADEDASVAATAALSLGLLGETAGSVLAEAAIASALGDPREVVRGGAAIALAKAHGRAAPRRVVDELLSWAAGGQATEVPYLDGDLAGYAARSLALVLPDESDEALDALLGRLPTVSGAEALPVVGEALRRVFPGGPIVSGTPFDALTERQKRVVRALAGSPSTWLFLERAYGNFAWLIGSYGLPSDEEAMRAYAT